MPILDYQKASEKTLQNIRNNKNISKANLEALESFLDAYDVRPARLNMFLKHIKLLLVAVPNIKDDMKNPELINKTFKEYRQKLNQSYYEGLVNVSLRFVKWLNDGDKPRGFKDVKNTGKNKKRDLEAEDMITWDDGLNLAKKSHSIQFKAIILTQLDGGFRPSELIDLNYGDVVYEKPFYVAKIRDGKTGKRDVPLYHCVPYLKKWLDEHPTKKANDPLWIAEFITYKSSKGDIVRYKYAAIRKRLNAIAKAIGLEKPVDFYNLRHSACTLAKLSNTPVDLAATKFGHSVKYYVETYGRLDIKGTLERYNKHLRLSKDKGDVVDDKNVICDICGFDNPPKSDMCSKCLNPLTIEKALQIKSEKDREIDELKGVVSKLAASHREILRRIDAFNVKGKPLDMGYEDNDKGGKTFRIKN